MELVAEFVYVTIANETLMKQYACNMWLSFGFATSPGLPKRHVHCDVNLFSV